MTHDALVAFGANLGDGEAVFQEIETRFMRDFGAVRSSPLFRTKAVTLSAGSAPEPDYWNAVIQVQVPQNWKPGEFLDRLLALEKELGRIRTGSPQEHWSARTADLDLLLWDDQFLDAAPHLVLPHPMMAWRRFVLEPACRIVPDRLHPLTGQTLAEMLAVLQKREEGEEPTDGDPFLLWDSMEPVPQELLERSRMQKCPILARRWVCRNGESSETFRKLLQLLRKPPNTERTA